MVFPQSSLPENDLTMPQADIFVWNYGGHIVSNQTLH